MAVAQADRLNGSSLGRRIGAVLRYLSVGELQRIFASGVSSGAMVFDLVTGEFVVESCAVSEPVVREIPEIPIFDFNDFRFSIP